MKKQNEQQNIEIARLQEWKKSFEKRFDDFTGNDFEHLRIEIKEIKSWLFYGFVAVIGVTIIVQTLLKLFV